MHNNQVVKLVDQLGEIALSDKQLNNICSKLFKSKFIGVFMQDSKIPAKDGYMIVNNDLLGNSGIHWLSCVKKKKDIYIYDSFGRHNSKILPIMSSTLKRQGYTIHNTDLSDQDQYGMDTVDCGHRCISSLKICNKYGLKAFMSL